MCGKLYGQFLKETAADYLQETLEPGETIRERHMKTQTFLAGLQSSVVTLVSRRVPQAAACESVIHIINNKDVAQEPQGNHISIFQ